MGLGQLELDVQRLAADLQGRVVMPGDGVYEEARRLHNAMIDRHPAVIVRCAGGADVTAAIKFARDHDLPLAVRGGGHSGAGLGSVDDGLVIDLSSMCAIEVDAAAGTVRVGGGATLADLDAATATVGAVVPTGVVSATGIGGLTLGGGIGHLTRRFGLTIDNLLGAEMVLADGSRVSVDADRHPDLFWAIRGGGGNFGVVTSFLFRLNPLGTVTAGPTLWPIDQAAEVLTWYRQFIPAAPEALNGFFAFLTVPPAPSFPAELHGQQMCGIVWCHTGPEDQAAADLAPVERVGRPALHAIHSADFPHLQTAFDALYPPGMQWYWRADFFAGLSDEAVSRHVDHGRRMPTALSSMHLYPIDGAARRTAVGDTAFSHRDVTFAQVIVGVDPDPANGDLIRNWTVDYWEALHPFSSGGAYVNFLGEGEGTDRVRATYGPNFARLARIKAEYDPDNVFRINQNIAPAQ